MRRRAFLTLLQTGAWLLLVAVPALAQTDNGEGLAGETDDKVVTFFSLGVIVFFALFVIVLSVIGNKREKRKREKKAARLHQRTGW